MKLAAIAQRGAKRDFIDLHDRNGTRIQRLTGTKASFWSDTVQGNRIEVRITSDNQTNGYGALVTKVAMVGGAAARLGRIELWHQGDRLDPTDVLDVPGGGDAVELEVRAFTPRGDPVATFSFDPRVQSAEGEPPISVEAAGNRVRVRAARRGAEGMAVQIYDAARPELAAKFLVSVRSGRNRIDRIQILDRGRVIQSTDVLTMRAGERLEFEVQGLGRRGEVVGGLDFTPAVRSSGAAPIAVEKLAATRIRIQGGRTAAQSAPVEIYDTARPELSAKFNVTIRSWQPGDPNPIDRIDFIIPDGQGGQRVASPGETIQLTTRGGSNDRLTFRISATNPGGHGFDLSIPTVAVDVLTDVDAEYGGLEKTGPADYLFRAGSSPHASIHLTAFDRSNPDTRAVLTIATVHSGGWGRNRVDRIQILDRGRELQATDVLVLGVDGQPGDSVDLDVRALNRRGDVISDFDFQPGVRSSTRSPVTIEKISPQRFRLNAGAFPAENATIEIYDQRHPDAAARLTVSVRAIRPGNSIVRLEFHVADERGVYRTSTDDEVIRLTTRDGGTHDLTFSVAAFNQAGHGFDMSTVQVDVSTSVVGWYGSLEMVGPGSYVFHAGMMPSPVIRITAVDRPNPAMRRTLLVSTSSRRWR